MVVIQNGVGLRPESQQTISSATLLIVAVIWLTPPLALTMPRTEMTAAFDTADAAKLVVLVGLASLCANFVLQRLYARAKLWSGSAIAVMAAYIGYGMLSSTWSALPSVTIDKAGTMGMLLVFAIAISTTIRTRSQIDRLLFHLSSSILAFSTFLLMVLVYDPTLAGMDRLRIHTGGDGIIHPTASGATASLGLLILLISHRVWQFTWSTRLALVAIPVHGIILWASNSRMSILMLTITAGPMLWSWCPGRWRARLAVSIAAGCLAIILFDPGLVGMSKPLSELGQYATRGQDAAELTAASGRMEMWVAIAGEIVKSPWMGHGYFVTSEKGELTVWFHTANYLSHNLLLQAWVTTGIIGVIMLTTSLGLLIRDAVDLIRQKVDPTAHAIGSYQRGVTIAVMMVWYAGWSVMAEGFLGPLRPESVVFFVLLGLSSPPNSSGNHTRVVA